LTEENEGNEESEELKSISQTEISNRQSVLAAKILTNGEITRRGYRIEWFIGDHGPRHVHVYDAKERFLGRLDIERMRGIEGWMPSKKLIKVIEELKREGRL
jgi:hypothetical protein